MKNLTILALLLLIFAGCTKPDVVLQDGKQYRVAEWDGGTFTYAAYKYKGGSFDPAISILKQFGEIVKTRNIGEISLGIYPDFKNWDLGMITNAPLDIDHMEGFPLLTKTIPAGTYATMTLKGHPESMFTMYENFRKLLIRDGYIVESKVYEIYTYDTFNNSSIPIEERIGEIRYKISKN